MAERLEARHRGGRSFRARLKCGDDADPEEICYDRGWTDGLPVTPPTDARVLAMLAARGEPDEIIGKIRPISGRARSKAAINAVLAGCKPDTRRSSLRCVGSGAGAGIHAARRARDDVFLQSRHHREWPDREAHRHEFRHQRARARQSRQRKHRAGAQPDRAERRRHVPEKTGPLSARRASSRCALPRMSPIRHGNRYPSPADSPPGLAVTLFQGHGPEAWVDQKSRTPEALTRSAALSLVKIGHPYLVQSARAILALARALCDLPGRRLGPQAHRARAYEATIRPGKEIVAGQNGVGEGSASRAGEMVPKFHEDGLMVVRGGPAGCFRRSFPGGWLPQPAGAAAGDKGNS